MVLRRLDLDQQTALCRALLEDPAECFAPTAGTTVSLAHALRALLLLHAGYPMDWALSLERLVEFKQAYWEQVLPSLGDGVDVVCEHDDLAGQRALLFSPDTYRSVVKPWHKKLFHFIKSHTPAKLFYHTDGAVRPLIGDLMDAGMDILNPVQFTAANMNLKELKQEFGRDLVFWGAGVDTQGVLGSGTPEEVKEDVKRNIEALAPGGGFIFATVHDIQANVPPENIMAMWETWKTYGVY